VRVEIPSATIAKVWRSKMDMDCELQKYFILVAPAVAFMLVLSGRQARISVIARDNVRQILESKNSAGQKRANNLIEQNCILLNRYRLIQCGLIVMCVGLLVAGWMIFYLISDQKAFKEHPELFWAGVVAMGIGALFTLYEIVTGVDTLRHEVKFAEWYAFADQESTETNPPEMSRFVLFRRWKRSKTDL
jgi:hypothetical protein